MTHRNARPTVEDIRDSRRVLNGVTNVTPLLTSRTLTKASGAKLVYLKAENYQRGGSFKLRGAYTKLASVSHARRSRGVVAFSSGNHGQGVALAAAEFGIPALILMPHDGARRKLAAVKSYGAEVVFYDRFGQDREALAREIAQERGMTLIPPFDDPQVVAGQGTAMLEVFDQAAEQPTVVFAPVGGGGLISGTAIAAKETDPRIRVIGIEAEDANDTKLSMAAGRRVSILPPRTIADGMRGTTPGAFTFPIVQELVDAIETVSEGEICSAVRFAAFRLKCVLEPTGAVGLALLLSRRIDLTSQVVTVVLSGGNIDSKLLSEIVNGTDDAVEESRW